MEPHPRPQEQPEEKEYRLTVRQRPWQATLECLLTPPLAPELLRSFDSPLELLEWLEQEKRPPGGLK